MEEKHPKRKKDSANPYTLSIENGIKYVSFEDSEGYIQKIEISSALFSLFDEFELDDVSYMNVVSRHHEHSELTEQSLNDRAFQLPEPMEDGVMVDWSEDTPRYLTDVTMPDSGAEVASLAAVESYIVDVALQDSPNETYIDVEAIVKEFTDAYFAADSDVMKKHFSRTRNVEFTVYEGGDPDKVVINAIKGLDNISADIEEKGYCIASVEFKKSAESDYYIYLTIEIIREDNQWKIAYYTLEM